MNSKAHLIRIACTGPCLNIWMAVAVMAVVSMLTFSCSSTSGDTTDILYDAEAETDRGNYAEAVDLCASLNPLSDDSRLSVSQLCRVAMVYLAAADNDIDHETNTGIAVDCLDRAFSLNADSAMMFIESLPVQKGSQARMALTLMHQKSVDLSGFIDPEDTLTIRDHDIDPDAPETHSHHD